jgi:WD40 repeat protein
LRLWHAALGEQIVHRDQAHEPHTALWWSEDGMRLFGAHAGGTADLYDLSDERCFQVLAPPQEEPHSENLGSASFSPDGRLAAVSDENCLRVWDIKHARLVHRFAKGEQEWMSALFDRSGKTLWIAGFNSPPSAREILLGDGGRVSLGAPRKLTDTSGSLLRAASADGRHLVLSNNGLGRFFVLEIATGKLVGLRHPGVLATAVAHDSSWVATSSYQTPGVRIWSLPEGKEERTIALEGVARQLVLTPDGATLYINLGHGLRAFRAGDWIERPLPELPALHGLTLAPDGRLLIVGEDHVRFLDTATWQETQRLHLPPQVGWLGDAHALFDQAGRHLMVHTALGTVVRWDLGCLEAELRALACAAGVPGKSISWLHANDWGRGAAFSCSSPPPRPASWIVWPCW